MEKNLRQHKGRQVVFFWDKPFRPQPVWVDTVDFSWAIEHFSNCYRLKRDNSWDKSLSSGIITQVLFQLFQPGLRPVEKVEQPNQPKTASPPIED